MEKEKGLKALRYPIYRIIDPATQWMVARGLHPNLISLFGFFSTVAAGWMYHQDHVRIAGLLVLLGGLSMRQAVGTSLVIIALKSFSGFYKYQDVLAAQDLTLDWQIIALVIVLGIIGSLAGNLIGNLIPQEKLKKGFGVFLIIMGGYILFKSVPGVL